MLPQEVTISSGEIAVWRYGSGAIYYFAVDTESDASTDDLESIDGLEIGDVLVIRPASSGRTVVVKNGDGNLVLNGSDFTMSTRGSMLMLMRDYDIWFELSRSSNLGIGEILVDAVIKGPVSSSITADANIAGSVGSDSITADSVILVSQSASVTANATVFNSVSGSFTADAIIPKNFKADCTIFNTVESSITADAAIVIALGGSITADAQIAGSGVIGYILAAAYIVNSKVSDSFTADADITN